MCYYSRIKMVLLARGGTKTIGRRTAPLQVDLPFRTWGGRRAGAGRKPAGKRAGMPHVARPEHKARHPVHVTLRAVRRLSSLRSQTVFRQMRRSFCQGSREWFRVVHFSVQADHVHPHDPTHFCFVSEVDMI